MVDKEEAERKGITTISGGSQLEAKQAELLAQLRQILPEAVNGEGQVDIKALRDALGIAASDSNDQGYELTFAGKGLARAQANLATECELKCEPQQSSDWDATGNVVIRGDNLDVLKILYQNYFGKIKMIYIDPPYNTQSENFVYKDDFKESDAGLIAKHGLGADTADFLHNVYSTRSHSGWLAFMYPRLKLARELLREDGVIFISIDDNEQASLKLICDEIFGEPNYVACLHVEMSATQGMKVSAAQKGGIVKNAEHVLAYAKDKAKAVFKPLYEKREWDTHYSIYYDRDSGASCSLFEFLKEKGDLGDRFRAKDVARLYSDDSDVRNLIHHEADRIWQDGNCNISMDLSHEQEQQLNDGKVVQYKREERTYYLHKTRNGVIRQLLPLSLAVGETDGFDRVYGLRKIRGDWWADYYKDMSNINKEGNVVFKNGKKPMRLVRDLAKLSTKDGDIVMDFFAGSGTSGEAIMRLNAEKIAFSPPPPPPSKIYSRPVGRRN